MKKTALLLVALVAGTLSINAQIYKGTKTTVSFFSSTAMEDISATDTIATMLLNSATGDVVANINIKGFVFPNALMQEHFNENYMETDKEGPKDDKGKVTYPNRYGKFKGKINETVDYTKDGVYNVTVTGNLTIHNVTKPRTIPGTITVKGGTVTIDCKFDVMLVDHDIKVPEAVGTKIAEKIQVTLKSTMVVTATKK